ncbi:MAG TPA: hypothetical protein VLV50_13045 [Stellaceae bacterium]|nr:hypothetical protein [Stellaceae bacterium]
MDGAAAELEATLARLPDEWTLLPRRRIGGDDGPEAGIVLLHPEIGAAVIDLARNRAAAAEAALTRLIAQERIAGDGESLPVVALALEKSEIADVGARLAASFEGAVRCEMSDPQWPDRLLDVLLSAEDAAMAPLSPPPTRMTAARAMAPEAEAAAPSPYVFRVEPEDAPLLHDEEDAADEYPVAPPRRLPSWAALTLGVLILAGGAGTAFFLANEAAAPSHVAIESNPPPATSAAPLQAPADLAAKPTEPPLAPLASAPPQPPEPVPMPEVASAPPAASPGPQPTPAPAAEATPHIPPPAVAAALEPKPAPTPPAVATATASKPASPAQAKPVAVHAPPKAPAAAVAAKTRPPAPPRKSDKALADLEPNPAKAAGTSPRLGAIPDSSDPPIDASDLPALEGSAAPPANQSASALPPDRPQPAYYGVPAPSPPLTLLPQASAPAAMPPANNGPPVGGMDTEIR